MHAQEFTLGVLGATLSLSLLLLKIDFSNKKSKESSINFGVTN